MYSRVQNLPRVRGGSYTSVLSKNESLFRCCIRLRAAFAFASAISFQLWSHAIWEKIVV